MMGLFDDITCDAELPETPVPPTGGFQTKSLPEPYMDKYAITSDGLDSAPTGHVISDSIELTCHSCGKVMYRKEGL